MRPLRSAGMQQRPVGSRAALASAAASGGGAPLRARRALGRRSPLLKARRLPPILAACGVVVACCHSITQLWPRAWLPVLQATCATEQSRGCEAERRKAEASREGGYDATRRQLLAGSGAIASGALWAAAPEDADAFRIDRIQNAKATYVPKIRKYYQKLEGLRDDIYLITDVGDRRLKIGSRAADWNKGIDRLLVGDIKLVPGADNMAGCNPFAEEPSVKGSIVLIPRGKCTFNEKVKHAEAAGAKAVIVYDQKISSAPPEKQGKTGATRSKSQATRAAGDALSGGVALLPFEQGITIMSVDSKDPDASKPGLDAVMINLINGTDIAESLQKGVPAQVTGVDRFEFKDGIDRFIKKDLPKMLAEMEVLGNTLRISKDDMNDPIIKVLKKSREGFAAAVKAKDYGQIQVAWDNWQRDLTAEGNFGLTEFF